MRKLLCYGDSNKALADAHGVRFADASSWDIELASDFDHFSERGHRQFAEALLRFLQQPAATAERR